MNPESPKLEIPDTPTSREPEQQNHAAIAEAVRKAVDALGALTADDRSRAIAALLSIFGHTTRPPQTAARAFDRPSAPIEQSDEISPKAIAWMSRNQITREQLEDVFSIDESGIELIAAAMPGTTRAKQTAQAYILCGLRTFLRTGDPQFTDDDARKICQDLGCYDYTNHTKSLRELGNRLGGSKDLGWKLTTPGLAEAAQIVKALSQG